MDYKWTNGLHKWTMKRTTVEKYVNGGVNMESIGNVWKIVESAKMKGVEISVIGKDGNVYITAGRNPRKETGRNLIEVEAVSF